MAKDAIVHCSAFPMKRGDHVVRIDLQSAFYAVPIPLQLKMVSAFRWRKATYAFNVLSMGLYISPAILQAVVQQAVRAVLPSVMPTDDGFAWFHLDNVLIVANSASKTKKLAADIIRQLHMKGFQIALRKSQLAPVQSLYYCGLCINTATDTFAMSTTRMKFFEDLLWSPQRFSASALGYLAFWLFALGLSSVTRCLLRSWSSQLIHILRSAPWPLLGPPERVWASDALDKYIAVVAPSQLIFRGEAFATLVFENKLLGLFVAAYFAPQDVFKAVDCVCCDSYPPC